MSAQKQPGLPITIYAKPSTFPEVVELFAGINFRARRAVPRSYFGRPGTAGSVSMASQVVEDLASAITCDIYADVFRWIAEQRDAIMRESRYFAESQDYGLAQYNDRMAPLADLEKRIRSLSNVTLDESVKKVLGEYLRPK